jgi:hypothetical protein
MFMTTYNYTMHGALECIQQAPANNPETGQEAQSDCDCATQTAAAAHTVPLPLPAYPGD